MTSAEKAIAKFREGANCAQSVLTAFNRPEYPGDKECMAISSGFGSGYGGSNGTCGAVSGAIMVLGIHFLDQDDPINSRKTVYDKVHAFSTKFIETHGNLQCNKLLGVDMGTIEGRLTATENNLYATKCESFIISACELIDKMMHE